MTSRVSASNVAFADSAAWAANSFCLAARRSGESGVWPASPAPAAPVIAPAAPPTMASEPTSAQDMPGEWKSFATPASPPDCNVSWMPSVVRPSNSLLDNGAPLPASLSHRAIGMASDAPRGAPRAAAVSRLPSGASASAALLYPSATPDMTPSAAGTVAAPSFAASPASPPARKAAVEPIPRGTVLPKNDCTLSMVDPSSPGNCSDHAGCCSGTRSPTNLRTPCPTSWSHVWSAGVPVTAPCTMPSDSGILAAMPVAPWTNDANGETPWSARSEMGPYCSPGGGGIDATLSW